MEFIVYIIIDCLWFVFLGVCVSCFEVIVLTELEAHNWFKKEYKEYKKTELITPLMSKKEDFML
jgi:hypothetical protein